MTFQPLLFLCLVALTGCEGAQPGTVSTDDPAPAVYPKMHEQRGEFKNRVSLDAPAPRPRA